jgi:transcriptional regulator with XRE-family HTH domain
LFGRRLAAARGTSSRRKFAQQLGLSYTFVREMELGNRFPSDELVAQIAGQLHLDERRCLLEVYHDRSPALGAIFEHLGLVGEGQDGGLELPKRALPDRGSTATPKARSPVPPRSSKAARSL